jgi:predicted RNA binding protein YcfA (HicA-like mRNA interferase family)
MPAVETVTAKILKRLLADDWYLARNGANHDVYRHGARPGVIVVPRHRVLSSGVARSIAKLAGWV